MSRFKVRLKATGSKLDVGDLMIKPYFQRPIPAVYNVTLYTHNQDGQGCRLRKVWMQMGKLPISAALLPEF